jgi:hypothetical protein
MDGRAVKRIVARAGAVGGEAVEFTVHALLETMPDDGVTVQDVFHVLAHVEEVAPQDEDGRKWKAYGPIVGGEEYAVVTLLLDGGRVRVLTTHEPP